MKFLLLIASYLLAIVIAALVVYGTLELLSTSTSGDHPVAVSPDREALLKAAREGDTQERVNALLVLAGEKEDLAQVVPLLAKASINMDSLVQTAGQTGIERLGAEAVEHLKPLFESGNRSDFLAACSAMRFIGEDAKELLPQATKPMDGDNRTEKMASLFALSRMGESAIPYLPKIEKLLDDPDMNNRIWSLRVIESLGPSAAELGPKVLKMLKEDVVSVRGRAAIALGAIGPVEQYDVVEELSKKLDAFTQIEKERALIGLGYLGERAKAALPEIETLMKDPSRSCSVPAATARWKITGEHKPSIDVLLDRMNDLSDRPYAVEELGTFGPSAAAAVDPLVTLLKSKDPIITDNTAMQETAIISLGAIGQAAGKAIPVLEDFADNSNDSLIRFAARESISSIKTAMEKEDP